MCPMSVSHDMVIPHQSRPHPHNQLALLSSLQPFLLGLFIEEGQEEGNHSGSKQNPH